MHRCKKNIKNILCMIFITLTLSCSLSHKAYAEDASVETCQDSNSNDAGCKMQNEILQSLEGWTNNAKEQDSGHYIKNSFRYSTKHIWLIGGVVGAITQGLTEGSQMLLDSAKSIYSTPLLEGFVASFSNTLYHFATNEFSTLSHDMYTIACYIFAIWILIQACYTVLGLNSGFEFAMQIAKNCMYLVAITMMIGGTSTQSYWQYFIVEPLKISESISSAITLGGTVNPCMAQIGSISDTQSILVQHMACMENNVENTMKNGIVIGLALPLNLNTVGLTVFGVMSDQFEIILFLIALGLFTMTLFGLIIVYYSFFLIDIILRLCIVSAFAPIFIGFSAVPQTRHIAKAAFTDLLGAFVNLTIMSILIGFEGNIMYDALKHTNASLMSNPSTLVQSIGGYVPLFLNPGYWEFILIGFSTVILTKQMHKMFDAIFGVTNSNITADYVHGKAVEAATAATSVATMGAGAGLRAASAGAKYGMQKTSEAAGNAKNKIDNTTAKFNNAGGWSAYRKKMFSKGKG